MADKLDEIFSKISNGAKLLSSIDLKVLSRDITQSNTEQLKIEALENFKDRQEEDEELESWRVGELESKRIQKGGVGKPSA